MPPSKGERTKKRIVDVAIKLAAKTGFADTSFQMVADELGLSQSAVMHHFPHKNNLFEELVAAMIRHNHETVEGLMDISDNAGRRLLKHCLGNTIWSLRYKHSEAPLLILLYYNACHETSAADMFSRMISAGRGRLLAHLLAGQREGLFTLDSPQTTAEILQDSLFGAMLYVTSSPKGSVTPARLEEKWRQAVLDATKWSENPPRAILPAEKFNG